MHKVLLILGPFPALNYQTRGSAVARLLRTRGAKLSWIDAHSTYTYAHLQLIQNIHTEADQVSSGMKRKEFVEGKKLTQLNNTSEKFCLKANSILTLDWRKIPPWNCSKKYFSQDVSVNNVFNHITDLHYADLRSGARLVSAFTSVKLRVQRLDRLILNEGAI